MIRKFDYVVHAIWVSLQELGNGFPLESLSIFYVFNTENGIFKS